MTSQTVVVLGAGIGGIVAASRLRKALPSPHRVILIERESNHLFQPSLLWLMTGQRTPRAIQRPLAALQKHGIELVHGEIELINTKSRSVHVSGQEMAYDYLIIALGAELAPENIPGLSQAGHNFYTADGAESLRQAIATLEHGHLVVLVSGMPFKCPAAPYEASMLLEAELRRRGVRKNVTVDFYTPEPGPMPVAGPEVSAQVKKMVEDRNISVHAQHQVTKIDVNGQLVHFANGATALFDLLAYVPPHRAPTVVRESKLIAESGWITVNKQTLETQYPGVYAIGDVTGIPLASGKPLPKAGVFAHGQAEVVAHNIVGAIEGKGTPRAYDGYGECFIEIGDGRAGYGSGNFYAEPAPKIGLKSPGRWLHFGKVLYEKYWLYKWF